MGLTADGAQRLATLVARDLEGASIEVSDGEATARTLAQAATADGAVATVVATFATGEANFEWRIRRVFTRDGVLLDEEAGDWGRKAPDREWTVEVPITLGAG